MPVTMKSQKPVAMAQTPEFKALQDKVAAAKTALDEVMTAIASLESSVAPQGGQDIQTAALQSMPQESIKYNEDTTLARIVELTGK